MKLQKPKMSTFCIKNTTLNKVVLSSVSAFDELDAAGQYVSILMISGIVSFGGAGVVYGSGSSFSVPHKGWDFIVEKID